MRIYMQIHTIGYASNHFSEETMLESGLVGHTYTTDTKNEALENSLRGSSDTMEIQKRLAWPARKSTRTNPDVFSILFCRDMGDEMVFHTVAVMVRIRGPASTLVFSVGITVVDEIPVFFNLNKIHEKKKQCFDRTPKVFFKNPLPWEGENTSPRP